MEYRFKFLISIILYLILPSAIAEELVFFSHPTVLEMDLSKDKMRDIYLKKIRFWKDGKKIRPLDHAVGSVDKDKFNKMILGKTEAELTEHWIQEKQQTGVVQPLQVQKSEMLIYLVETLIGSVGYIANTPENAKLLETKKVKVILYE